MFVLFLITSRDCGWAFFTWCGITNEVVFNDEFANLFVFCSDRFCAVISVRTTSSTVYTKGG